MAAIVTGLLDQIHELTEARESRPDWDSYFMSIALLVASRSACERLHVGCVLVSGGDYKNRILSTGYNGFLSGAPHISRVEEDHEQGTVHAEQNAIANAALRGVSLLGATAYITHYPCVHCLKILASAGVKVIKYHKDYKNSPLVEALAEESQLKIERL
tara:strand:+ start:1323 stop:1799 length:477 start_codon:yes stop_codon:yes gene_type:complete